MRGGKKAWAELQNLPTGHLDSSPDATFKWWLWIANLGPHTRRVIGAGVIEAELTSSNDSEKHIVFRRVDSSTIEIKFSPAGIKIVDEN